MTSRLALAFLTRDRVELSEHTIEPLFHPDIDLWVMDGSVTEAGQMFPHAAKWRGGGYHVRNNVTGGADAAICYALTTLLHETEAPYVGLCENDVLLHAGWFGPCLALFERGWNEGLSPGAVSARAYEDRILCQRDGYSLMHNLGAGHTVFTREAARIVLNTYRTHWTTQNVKTFHQLCGLDIRRWWAFGGSQQALTVDWGINAVLAAHGLASLALTPSNVEMIGQNPPLADQGLAIVREPVELLRNDEAFEMFACRTFEIRAGRLRLSDQTFLRPDDGSVFIFAHQIGALGGTQDFWRQKWSQGFGPFAYCADFSEIENAEKPFVDVPVAGPCSFMVSGGKQGGRVHLTDTQSGYEMTPELPPEGDAKQTMQLAVPGNVAYRTIRLTALDPGVKFYGVQVSEPQPVDPTWTFDHSVLPKP